MLDTCEHVIAATATFVATLLAEAPNTHVLATSREALNVDGEQRLALQPLSLPSGAGVQDLAVADAVQLFVERAKLQQPSFALTREVGARVAAICSRLEGIPLAIELAAARTSSLSIEEISRRLDDRFGLLAAGPRATPPRQKTLRAALDWSYDLLTEEEQRTLRRLAVFAGNFALEAARHVVGARTVNDAAMLDLLTRLAARSLVLADVTEAGTRYGVGDWHGTAARNRALMLVGFAGAFRRGESAALLVRDVTFNRAGMEITIRRSKTDQAARGRAVFVARGRRSRCPVAAAAGSERPKSPKASPFGG